MDTKRRTRRDTTQTNGHNMKKTILFAAFSVSTKEEFESFLLERCKIEGFSRVDQRVVWADKSGKVYEEPSHQYIFFALSEENHYRINDWFQMFTIENTLLWEEDGKGKFVDLRQDSW